MKNCINLLLSAALLLTVASCSKIKGKGDVVSTKRTVTGYTGISLDIDGTVNYTPDSVYTLEILAQQNIADVIETNTDDGKLVIKYQAHKIIGKHDAITINITAPHTTLFNISGSGSFSLHNPIEEPVIRLQISGSGSTSAQALTANDLQVSISGSGSVWANSGVANYEHLDISGSGNIDLTNVIADSTYATISGSGDIRVNVLKYLEGTISGSGSILYNGNPIINSHISGSGSIKHM
ncbi:MAG TPA: head GIN domain-containing protein [Bacteroidales bacterium]|nr:head GIN domain-containing protein [Bacteroidales bacterium]